MSANYIFEATKKLAKEMENKFKKLHEDAITVWQNKEIRFDLQMMHIGLRKGEVLVDMINGVEDTKGNNGEKGYLIITNLRLIWHSDKSPKTNLSIGYDCITNLEIKQTKSRLRGNVQALFLRTKYKETRYEFIFTSLIENSPRLFTSFQSTLRSYDSTKLFRDFKVRGAIVQEKELIALPSEQIYHKYPGVWNISDDQGQLGVFYISNIRIAWFANLAESFNVSLPYVQFRTVRKKDTSLGQNVIIDICRMYGNFSLTFRSDKSEEIFIEISRLFRSYVENPILGLEVTVQEAPATVEVSQSARVFDDIEIVEPLYGGQTHASAAYFVSEGSTESAVVFSPELGLAIEATPNNITIEQLWRII
jgi:Bardet-Biedl syndrome 5 protein